MGVSRQLVGLMAREPREIGGEGKSEREEIASSTKGKEVEVTYRHRFETVDGHKHLWAREKRSV